MDNETAMKAHAIIKHIAFCPFLFFMEWAKVKELANPTRNKKEIFKNAPALNKKNKRQTQQTADTSDTTKTKTALGITCRLNANFLLRVGTGFPAAELFNYFCTWGQGRSYLSRNKKSCIKRFRWRQ